MIIQSLKMAIKSILSNKMRSFLTVLGVVIGVMAIVVLVSIGEGANSQVVSNIEGLGTNLITVNIRATRTNPITMEDVYSLADGEIIAHAAPVLSYGSATAKAGLKTYEDGSVEGSTPGYDVIRDLQVARGRFLKQPDVDNRSPVAVIGPEVAQELFGTTDVVGETFSLDGYELTIVGVLESQGSTDAGSQDNRIIIPYTLAERLTYQSGISTFYVSAASAENVDWAETQLNIYLNQVFSGDTDQYSVYSQTDMLDTLSETTATLTLMLGGIAAISLLVGGIGIMNIMLVSVSERTREIGIRKAIGAARGNILSQFLIEALVVSLMGGILGLVLALLVIWLLGPILEMTMVVSYSIAAIAIGFSLIIGVLFGLYPANKASKLRPIDALRYDN